MSSTADLSLPSSERVAAQPRERKRVFYPTMAIAMAVIVLIGFGPSFYFRALTARAVHLPSAIVWIHGLVFTSWVLVLLLQTTLVWIGKIQWHRRVGIAGVALAALMVVLGATVQILQARRDVAAGFMPIEDVDENLLLIGALFMMAIYGGLIGAAVGFRSRPEFHKRFILLGTVVLLGAATSRIAAMCVRAIPSLWSRAPLIDTALNDVFILVLAIHDLRTRGRLHPATVWGAIPILLMQGLSFTSFYDSDSATAFTTWIGNL
ncbi:MAG TPA: hypothetical protein VGM84_07710 [Steroidobacteraceae bacterium]|jgi:hypothetical protein